MYGTTAEKAGTVVHVSIGGQDLAATVKQGGSWGISAATLGAGRHKVVAAVTDAASNTGTATQVLFVGTGEPAGPDFRYRPDAAVRVARGDFVGTGRYDAGQRVVDRLARDRTATFEVRLTNRGDAADPMTVRGTPKSKQFTVAYRVGGRDVTRAVTAGTYRTGSVAPGKSVAMLVRVTRTKAARAGAKRAFAIRVVSAHAPAQRDTVTAVVRR
jgi:hypothetical protein